LPLFPLNTVTFPGLTLPLHIFEPRYRRLLTDIEAATGDSHRRFVVTAIRSGFEVGNASARSLYRIGTLVQVSELAWLEDGRADLEATALTRVLIKGTDDELPYLIADISEVADPASGSGAVDLAALALNTFTTYRSALSRLRGEPVLIGELPRDPELLSYSLGATALLSMRDRQTLLEATTTENRLSLLIDYLTAELGAMRAVPSLPATEVARSGWSPN
jgi:hypothetical protein